MRKMMVLTAFCAVLLAGCQKPAPEEKKAEEAPKPETGITLTGDAKKSAGIRTEAVRLKGIAAVESLPGTIEVAANRSAKVTPPAPGKVVKLLVQPGERVVAGQTLAIIDSFEVAQSHASKEQAQASIQQAEAALQTALAETTQSQAGVQVAEADIAAAKTRLASAQGTLARQKQLANAGAFAQGPLQAAQAEFATAQSELLKSQTELQAHQVVLQRGERLFKEEIISKAELEQIQLDQRQDEAEVGKAKQHVELARQTLEREKRIGDAGLLNAREIQTAEAEVRASEAEIRKAESAKQRAIEETRKAEKGVQAARTALLGTKAALQAAVSSLYALEGSGHSEGRGGQVLVNAPIAGIVSERNATLGETVDRATVLLTLQNAEVVQVTAQVPESDVARLRPGLRATITVAAYPKESFAGVVQSIGSQVDEKTRALPVRLLVSNTQGKLKAHMFARVALGTGAMRQVLAVPESAVVEEEGKAFVFVDKDGKYEKREVIVGTRSGGFVEIKSGIKAGENIVVEGAFVLKSESKKDELKGEE